MFDKLSTSSKFKRKLRNREQKGGKKHLWIEKATGQSFGHLGAKEKKDLETMGISEDLRRVEVLSAVY